jgi:dinuclear metal center YbgI/SA1388 family protein
MENWAPSGIAWEKDNVGLQIGSGRNQLKNVLLCLEVNSRVVEDAIKKKCNLIVSHHPLIFTPIKSINSSDDNSKIIQTLIKNEINLFSSHTNLDFTKEGVSFQLAKQLKLRNIRFLKNLYSNQYKVSVFVPNKYVEEVASAMHSAGGGRIGDYSSCSFRLDGKGTFKGDDHTNPFLGKSGKLEFVDEIRLEMVVDSFNLSAVLRAMEKNHPYEQVAYDVYKLYNDNPNFGIGAIGTLENEMTKEDFLFHVSKQLNIKIFRYTETKKKKISTVAVCGGSGSDLTEDAIKQSADAFITADVKYHKFQDAEGKILLIDAGHYETEILILCEIQKRLQKFLELKNIRVYKFKGSTNPVIFYNKPGE